MGGATANRCAARACVYVRDGTRHVYAPAGRRALSCPCRCRGTPARREACAPPRPASPGAGGCVCRASKKMLCAHGRAMHGCRCGRTGARAHDGAHAGEQQGKRQAARKGQLPARPLSRVQDLHGKVHGVPETGGKRTRILQRGDKSVRAPPLRPGPHLRTRPLSARLPAARVHGGKRQARPGTQACGAAASRRM